MVYQSTISITCITFLPTSSPRLFLYKVTRYLSSDMRWIAVLIVTQLTAYFHLRENVLDIMCLTDSLD